MSSPGQKRMRDGAIRVAHILDTLSHSGAETMLAVAGPLWSTYGVEPLIITKDSRPGIFSEALRGAGYDIAFVDPKPDLTFPVRLSGALRDLDVDVVHIHTEHANFWIAAASRASGVRRIVRTVHSVFDFDGSLRRERVWQRRVMRSLGVRMVAVGSSVANNEASRFQNPSVVIPNWYDTARFHTVSARVREAARERFALPEDALVVCSVGNCGWVKRHEILIAALTDLPASTVYLHLGEEESGRPEKALSASLGVEDRCRFLGPNADASEVLAACDVFVMPSRREGASIAALEAIASGVNCVLTDVPGLRDLKEIEAPVTWLPEDGRGVSDAIMRAATSSDAGPRDAHFQSRIRQVFGVESGVARYCATYAVSG